MAKKWTEVETNKKNQFSWESKLDTEEAGFHEELLRRTGQEPINSIIRQRKWQWIRHTLQKGDDSITAQAMQ